MSHCLAMSLLRNGEVCIGDKARACLNVLLAAQEYIPSSRIGACNDRSRWAFKGAETIHTGDKLCVGRDGWDLVKRENNIFL